MTSRSLKRRRTIRLNISIATSPALLALVLVASGLNLGATRALAGQCLQWGITSAKSADSAGLGEGSTKTALIRDPQVIAAAWEEADAVAAAERTLEPIHVAQLHSVVVKRESEAEITNAKESSLGEARLAKLPEDPFDETNGEQFAPLAGTEALDLFGGQDPEATSQEPLVLEDQGPTTDPDTSNNQYDLFNEPLELSEEPGQDGGSEPPAETNRFEVQMPDVNDQSWEQEDSATESVDLWMTSQEITPTEETQLVPRKNSDPSRIFEILTQGDTDSEEIDERYQYQIEELQREMIGNDPNDWLNMDLPQPDREELSELQRKILEAERTQNEKSCKEEIEKLRAQKVENIDLSIRLEGSAGQDFPFECTLEDQQPEPRQWPQITYMWKASGLCHKPLYFEQVHLERYGHSWGPIAQPLLSGVHFFGTIPILPYKMGLKTPNECVYTLGYYRPGDCAPYMIDAIPFTWRAAGFQAGFATGLHFVLP